MRTDYQWIYHTEKERRRTPTEVGTACAAGDLQHGGSGARHGVTTHDPSRIWASRRIHLGDRENAWNVYHHNDLGNELSQGSCVGCPEEGDEKRLHLHFLRASSCDGPPRCHLRLLHAGADDGLFHNPYLCHGDRVGIHGRDAFVPYPYLVPFLDPCETCRASDCAFRVCHDYDLTFSCRRTPFRGAFLGGLFPWTATDGTCESAWCQKNAPWSEH
jgi:hypothetical protein